MRSHVTQLFMSRKFFPMGFNTASGMRSHVTFEAGQIFEKIVKFQYRKRYEVTCDEELSFLMCAKTNGFNTASGMRSHVTAIFGTHDGFTMKFQYRKRYEVTCDSVSGRPQKQKAQNAVLENLLKAERVIACFRLSLHTPRLCNDPAAPYVARLAAIRGKSENLPRFFASERFSAFHNVA